MFLDMGDVFCMVITSEGIAKRYLQTSQYFTSPQGLVESRYPREMIAHIEEDNARLW